LAVDIKGNKGDIIDTVIPDTPLPPATTWEAEGIEVRRKYVVRDTGLGRDM
jgi:hypothetical protein